LRWWPASRISIRIQKRLSRSVRRLRRSISCARNDEYEGLVCVAWNSERFGRLYCAHSVPAVRAKTHYCFSVAACVGWVFCPAGTLFPIRKALRLPAPALVHELGTTSELGPLLSSNSRQRISGVIAARLSGRFALMHKLPRSWLNRRGSNTHSVSTSNRN